MVLDEQIWTLSKRFRKKVVLANSELLVSIRASSSAGMGGMFSIPAVGVRLVFRQAQVALDSPDLGKFPTATRRPALADHPHPLPCGTLVDLPAQAAHSEPENRLWAERRPTVRTSPENGRETVQV